MKKILATILASALGLGAWGDASVATQAELNSAISAAAAGDTITITAAGTYTMPSIPRNITIIGGVDGVVFNHTGSGNIATVSNGATIKNVTFNFGNENYHGFQHQGGVMTFDGCTLNGKLFGYGIMVFTNCTFNNATDYCMWNYGSTSIKYLNCTFNCGVGKAVNCYTDQKDTSVSHMVYADGCTFTATTENKPAFKINGQYGESQVIVTTANNTLTGFPRGISGYDNETEGNNAYMITNAVLDENDKIVSGEVNTALPAALVTKYVAISVPVTENANGTETIGIVSQPVTNSVQSANLFGAIKVTGVASNMFVAVPFEGFEAAGAARKAQDAVHPAGLADGTKMYVYDSAAGKYDVFEVSGNAWAKASKVTVGADGTVSVDDPDLERPLSAGSGVIVDRKSMDAPVYVYGQIPSSSSVRLAAGVSLVCAPSTNALEAVDLNALAWEGVTEAGGNAAGTRVKVIDGKDVIKFRGPDNKMVTYYCLGGKWGPVFRPADWDGKATVPAGTAFWYTCNNAAGATMAW